MTYGYLFHHLLPVQDAPDRNGAVKSEAILIMVVATYPTVLIGYIDLLEGVVNVCGFYTRGGPICERTGGRANLLGTWITSILSPPDLGIPLRQYQLVCRFLFMKYLLLCRYCVLWHVTVPDRCPHVCRPYPCLLAMLVAAASGARPLPSMAFVNAHFATPSPLRD